MSVWRRRFEIKSAVQCDDEAAPALDAPPPDRKHKHRRTSRGKRAVKLTGTTDHGRGSLWRYMVRGPAMVQTG